MNEGKISAIIGLLIILGVANIVLFVEVYSLKSRFNISTLEKRVSNLEKIAFSDITVTLPISETKIRFLAHNRNISIESLSKKTLCNSAFLSKCLEMKVAPVWVVNSLKAYFKCDYEDLAPIKIDSFGWIEEVTK